jgi:hypothetical protein
MIAGSDRRLLFEAIHRETKRQLRFDSPDDANDAPSRKTSALFGALRQSRRYVLRFRRLCLRIAAHTKKRGPVWGAASLMALLHNAPI